jgi:hypothetical protein
MKGPKWESEMEDLHFQMRILTAFVFTLYNMLKQGVCLFLQR